MRTFEKTYNEREYALNPDKAWADFFRVCINKLAPRHHVGMYSDGKRGTTTLKLTTEDLPDDTICGYDIETLVTFCNLCYRLDLPPDKMYEALRDASYVARLVYDDVQERINETLQDMFHKEADDSADS